MAFGDTGVSPSYKRPKFIAKIIFAAGLVGASSDRLGVLLCGLKTSAGAMAVDSTPVQVTSVDEIDTQAGPGSVLARMGYAAMRVAAIYGVPVYLQAVTETGTAATATITIGGTWTTAGELRFRIGGELVSVQVGAADTPTVVATAIAAAFNKKTRAPVTAVSAVAVATITSKNLGAMQKDWILYYDPSTSTVPAGLTVALVGSATVNTFGVRLGAAGGTGTENITASLTKLTSKRYARIAHASNDATNEALLEAQLIANGGPLSLLLEQAVVGHNGTTGAATTLAQTTMNNPLLSLLYMRNSESHPSEIAAAAATLRAAVEQTTPVGDFDGAELLGIAPQLDADLLTDAEMDLLLNAGVTPVDTVNGTARIVRGITSYCLNGAAQDERCLDWGDPTMPQYATIDLKLMYETEFRPANPIVRPDPAPEDPEPTAGIGYPRLWNSKVQTKAQGYYDAGWLASAPTTGTQWAPKASWNKAGKYIVCELNLDVARVQHRLDQVVRQVSNS